MSIRRWFSELGNPSLKCARVGHDMREREYREYRYPPKASWAVADRAWMKRASCKRCDHAEEPQEISRTALTGLTMSTEHWDQLKLQGRLSL